MFLARFHLTKKASSPKYFAKKLRLRSEEDALRKKINNQLQFDFQPSTLKITNQYRARYDRISKIIDDNPAIVEAVHKDLKKLLKSRSVNGPGRNCKITSDSVLRVVICQRVEGESLRGIIIRIDDSNFLRFFVRIYNDAMIDYSTFCTLRNAIRPKTWKKINNLLRDSAVEAELIDGSRLRTDTTAYEANIHWPTDSGLLWDTYRVLARLVNDVRKIDPDAASDRRLQVKVAKKLSAKIARRAGKKAELSKELKSCYSQLIGLVGGVLNWIPSVCERLQAGLESDVYELYGSVLAENLIAQMEHFRSLGLKVVDQATRRVIKGEAVPNEEKIFSIFEPHTELLIRGKAGKKVEFGHMISIQQVESKFITDYEVYMKRPVDFELVDPALESHRKTFGTYPDEFSADKGFFESMEKIKELEGYIKVVSIAKKGKRNQEETEREKTKEFKLGQMFRAGVEGTISVLKRALGLSKCLRKGLDHYASSVGEAVFVHNLLTLEAGYG